MDVREVDFPGGEAWEREEERENNSCNKHVNILVWMVKGITSVYF